MDDVLDTSGPTFFHGICRACITKNKELFPLFGGAKIKFGDKCFTIAEILYFGGRVKTSSDDKLPKHVCRKCLTRLIEIFSFQLKCIESDIKLKNIISNPIKSDENCFVESVLCKSDLSDGLVVKSEQQDLEEIHSAKNFVALDKSSLITDLGSENFSDNFKNLKNSQSDILTILDDKDPDKSVSKSINSNETNKLQQSLEKGKSQESRSTPNKKEVSACKDNATSSTEKISNIIVDLRSPKKGENEIDSKQGKFSCTFCKDYFDTWSDLGKHIVKHKIQNNYGRLQSESPPLELNSDSSKKKNLFCKICAQEFISEEKFSIHMKEHKRSRDNTSEAANDFDSDFSNEIKLSVLSEQEMPDLTSTPLASFRGRFCCDFCPANYKYRQDLNKHLRDKHYDKYPNHRKYGCSFCEKLFIFRLDCIRHEKIHKDPFRSKNSKTKRATQYKCLKCGKIFPTYLFVQKHMLVAHNVKGSDFRAYYPPQKTDSRQCFCQVCGIRCSDLQQMKEHLFSEHYKHPSSCPDCGEKFEKNIDMLRHRRQHLKDNTLTPSELVSAVYEDSYQNNVNGEARHLAVSEETDFDFKNKKIETVLNKTAMINLYESNFKVKKEIVENCIIDANDTSNNNESTLNDEPDNLKRSFCKYCPANYARESDLRKHIKTKHDDIETTNDDAGSFVKKWFCNTCNKNFNHENNLRIHIYTKHKTITSMPIKVVKEKTREIVYKCKVCDGIFSSVFRWKCHVVSKHKSFKNNKNTTDATHKCSICKKGFLRKGSLLNHMRTHKKTPALGSQSDLENKLTNNAIRLTTVDILRAKQVYKCLICPNKYLNDRDLRRHIKMYHCDTLKEYEQEKTEKHIFQCKYCCKWFLAASNLKVHMRRHASVPIEGELNCNTCNRTFKSVKFYNNHLNYHRNIAKKNQRYCSICCLIFPHERGYILHKSTKHKNS